MIWKKLASLILKNRLIILLSVLIFCSFMGFEAGKVKLTYNAGKILPVTDSAYIRYTQFRKMFGEDATAMVIGVKTPQLFKKDFFNDWYQLGNDLKKIKGISAVISVANIYQLQKDTVAHTFAVRPLVTAPLPAQKVVDSIKQIIFSQPFYSQLILSGDRQASLMAVSFDPKVVNTPARSKILDTILQRARQFGVKYNTPIHYSGQPYIRTIISDLVSHEFSLFLGLSLAITSLILLIFFRSFYSVIFPVIVVILGVICSLGLLVLNHYNITLLTGIIPPLIVIIGIPNSIFLLNKYYREYGLTGDKMQALHTVIEKVGITTFIANVTTAIGFGVLCFTNSQILTEFGLVASISIMLTFVLTLILIPIIFSYLPAPGKTQSGIKDRKFMQQLLVKVDFIVHNHRRAIYAGTIIILIIGGYGLSRIRVNSYLIDDLPQSSTTLTDLHFFESNFKGVLPLDVAIDTKHKNGVMNLGVINKIDRLETLISSYPAFSRSISLTQVLKYSTQAFYGGDSSFYRLPNSMEQNFILSYAANSGKSTNMLHNYLDTTKQITRVSFQMADIGSAKLNRLFEELQPRIDSIFNPKKYHVELTGSSVIFVKGANYMVKNLYQSLALAIFLIAMVMWILFRGFKMVLISILPNLIPLVITAGLMGFLGIPLKPSTILIFSIAMGISSDQTIYFLTRYRQELNMGSKTISQIVSDTIRETGISMIYIATILFFGFGIFAASTFGGTVVLGILLSFTLLTAMICNLTLLPAFLISFEKSIKGRKPVVTIDAAAQDL
ncbi:Fis family transcriptional regulator [Mucilaginibacter sp. PPCGB 2223]|uniref:efflux RND transporter permease subunit n=1 Tax=Mucilaginibacter sp. PPCGB 2223 TaxID=1886027 RepID=UPI000826A523|nr:MMPL family transporter [Mucilaginibacter sp. PPCGB 2223]OCX50811.1 Fis family transcriptional regulator [Mucilaginibacter sp. PPCGB 2223]